MTETNNEITVSWDGNLKTTEKVLAYPQYNQETTKRLERDIFLLQTDRFMLEDYPISSEVKQKYKEYRKYLRELPEQSDFPNLEIMDFETWCASPKAVIEDNTL